MKKWRNKITGEINEFMVHKRIEDSEDGNPVYAPFDGHIDDWEDYEEPKEYWCIDTSMMEVTYNSLGAESDIEEFNKEIGNYFETKEEAEKAIEKLKAVKRLKDKGFRFDGWTIDDGLKISICTNFEGDNIYSESEKEIRNNLDLLFGGEE